MKGNINKKHGWLTNLKRKERRDSLDTFTKENALQLITQIEEHPRYISKYLREQQPELENLLKKRDIAIIAIGTIFFKRGGEILGLRNKDVRYDNRNLYATFTIEKKNKSKKICKCGQSNGIKARFCKNCALPLDDIPINTEYKIFRSKKRKTRKDEFVPYVIEWCDIVKQLTPLEDAWFFPPLQVVFDNSYFDFTREHFDKRRNRPAHSGMTVQNLDRILQRLDPTMTSSMFRYGITEQLLNEGVSLMALKKIGDWSSTKMPEIYAHRLEMTEEERRWSDNEY